MFELMLGHLGGVLVVACLLVRDPRFIVPAVLLYGLLSAVVSFPGVIPT